MPRKKTMIAGVEDDRKFCPSLPSSEYAYELVIDKKPIAIIGIVGTSMLRASLIAAGIYAFGRPGPNMMRNALAGAAMVEIFVIGCIAWKGTQ